MVQPFECMIYLGKVPCDVPYITRLVVEATDTGVAVTCELNDACECEPRKPCPVFVSFNYKKDSRANRIIVMEIY